MRKNFPVTDDEYPVSDETLIVSRTDLKGRLSYVNEDFIDAAEFTSEKLSGISSAIASAVEEQGATTQEVARNVQRAAQGAQEVSSNVGNLQRGAAETGTASSQVLSAAQTLSRDSTRLKAEVNNFLNSVRVA